MPNSTVGGGSYGGGEGSTYTGTGSSSGTCSGSSFGALTDASDYAPGSNAGGGQGGYAPADKNEVKVADDHASHAGGGDELQGDILAPATSPPVPPKYKTELCNRFPDCKYGDRCLFAHGIMEVRNSTKPKNYKTKPCVSWESENRCRYGGRCDFAHGKFELNHHVRQFIHGKEELRQIQSSRTTGVEQKLQPEFQKYMWSTQPLLVKAEAHTSLSQVLSAATNEPAPMPTATVPARIQGNTPK